jgi:hypothetical protein
VKKREGGCGGRFRTYKTRLTFDEWHGESLKDCHTSEGKYTHHTDPSLSFNISMLTREVSLWVSPGFLLLTASRYVRGRRRGLMRRSQSGEEAGRNHGFFDVSIVADTLRSVPTPSI